MGQSGANNTSQFTSYHAFCAVVVLYVYVIQQSVSHVQARQEYLSAAVRCQTQLSTIAEEGSLAERYCLVLEELQKEAVQLSERSQADMDTETLAEDPPRQSEMMQHERNVIEGGVALEQAFDIENMADAASFDATPGSSVYEISGWGDFDSMVSLCAVVKRSRIQ